MKRFSSISLRRGGRTLTTTLQLSLLEEVEPLRLKLFMFEECEYPLLLRKSFRIKKGVRISFQDSS